MSFKLKLTLLFTCTNLLVLGFFAIMVIFSAQKSREQEFYSLLEKEAITKANLYLEAKIPTEILQNIYLNNRTTLNEVEVAIYSQNFTLLYHDAYDIDFVKETPEMFQAILEKGKIQFYQDKWQVIGILYPFAGKGYIITAAAYDEYGFTKLSNLYTNSILLIIGATLLLTALGYFLAGSAIKPIAAITESTKIITATNLDLRINQPNTKDEISALVKTINQMLNRLEESFEAQKNLVANLSHEVRTPLAAILTELELANKKDKKKTEYLEAISNALADAKRLNRITTSILNLAKANYDTSTIHFKKLRVDELLMETRTILLKQNKDYHISLDFSNTDSLETNLEIQGNEYLLSVAFLNLMENACKFSENHTCKVLISPAEKSLKIDFADNGIGISTEEIEKIFSPFYRGKNKSEIKGTGLGLHLTKKIIDLHKGEVSVKSSLNKGSRFSIKLNIAS
ncbi:MAG: ATP-binding protein [Luteibaculaceae bacterium]